MGRHCFAWSRDARDPGGMLGHKHERVCWRMARRLPACQRLVDVTGDQSTDSHLDTDIDVSLASVFFVGGRLVQMHLQAEHWQRHANALMVNTAAYRECGKTKRRTVRCTVKRQLLSDRTAHVCRALFRNNILSVFPLNRSWRERPGRHHVRSRYLANARRSLSSQCAMRQTREKQFHPDTRALRLLSFAQLDAQHSSGNGPLSQGALGVSSRPGSSAPNGPEAGPA